MGSYKMRVFKSGVSEKNVELLQQIFQWVFQFNLKIPPKKLRVRRL